MLQFSHLKAITGGQVISEVQPTLSINHLLTDSRKVIPSDGTLFFAIKGERHDGHAYIKSLIDAGVKQFIIDHSLDLPKEEINVLRVENTLNALQQIAIHKRNQFSGPVVGITGSNGKTIVKEWLAQMLMPFEAITKNPGSYNSQVGVPLSVWRLNNTQTIGIFEAGISETNEMSNLQQIIQPSEGIFTNIGAAHDEGFISRAEKVKEKALLFKETAQVVYCKDHTEIDSLLSDKGFTWGKSEDSHVRINSMSTTGSKTRLKLSLRGSTLELTVPFTAPVAIENVMHCICYMLMKGYSEEVIQKGLNTLRTVKMRLEMKRGVNNSLIIDDTYNNDLAGLEVAIDFLVSQKQRSKKIIVFSDLYQTGLSNEELYGAIEKKLQVAQPNIVIAIGKNVSKHLSYDGLIAYPSTEAFLDQQDLDLFENATVLVKGARVFEFEKIVRQLEEKIHGTQLEINLDALTSNLNYYRSKLKPNTKLMVMVKAFAYGSGSLEIANLLQHHRVDYLGVAYADEGVQLRKNGITLPIMVMNPTQESFEKILKYELEPEIYNFNILNKFISFLDTQKANIHLKLDTGMHRLGFASHQLDELTQVLQVNTNIQVKAMFSHLAGADNESHNDFSHNQARQFDEMSMQVSKSLNISPIRHLVNSPGIVRFPQYHFDMVRLGIGLYGVETNLQEQDKLQPISSLKTIISQINELKAGDTVGYGRKGKIEANKRIATIAIGYADGYSRAFSNGIGQVFIHGKRAPVVGSVCMDMTMVDVTHIPEAAEEDEVEIFGKNITISEMAGFINTIPYEILTSVSQRVKRIYHTE
ncbi:MAG: bifunctional UDP-N-acetylmuramoyl-tripeptide:D-alanyl-D-alanine ligase/alanine racemase [Fulvivirga sp.]